MNGWSLRASLRQSASFSAAGLKRVGLAFSARVAASVPGRPGASAIRSSSETEQRALQRAGERKIVVLQQQRVGERQEIHDRDVLDQIEPVGARDRNAFILERAQDRLEQHAAPAHQHDDVAGRAPRASCALPVGDREPALGPMLDRSRDPPRELDRRIGSASASSGASHASPSVVVLGIGLHRRPQLHERGRFLADRFVDGLARVAA